MEAHSYQLSDDEILVDEDNDSNASGEPSLIPANSSDDQNNLDEDYDDDDDSEQQSLTLSQEKKVKNHLWFFEWELPTNH